jgi:outer membrane protein insertion porin family
MNCNILANIFKNKKVIFIFLCFIFLFFSNIFCASNNISDIKIEGLKNFDESIVSDEISIKKKQLIDNNKINDDIRKILGTGYFDDVAVETKIDSKGLIVIYKVVEKPMIKTLKFEGNTNFKKNQIKMKVDAKEGDKKDFKLEDKKFFDENEKVDFKISKDGNKLKGKMDLKEKGFYDEEILSQAKDSILEFYKEQGFGDAVVEYIVEDLNAENKVNITFFISEGQRLKLKDIEITGNNKFKNKVLLKALGIKRKKIFKEDEYKKGFDNIKNLYREEGFLDIDIKEISRELDDNRENVSLKIEIKEGEKYKIGKISFIGNTKFFKEDFFKLMECKEGEVFKQTKFDFSMYKLQNFYAEKGYIKASINPEILYKNGSVDIVFHISENNIVYIDRIYIEGNEVTKDYVIRREFIVKERSIFDVNKVKRSQEKIFNLGFFKDVQIEMEPSAEDSLDLIFKVEEQPTGIATVGGGYSSEDGVIGNLQFTKNNLFGRGQKINLLWEFGKTKQNYQINFTDPYIFKSNIAFGADVFNMKRDRDYVYTTDSGISKTDVYTEQHKGGAIKFGRKIFENSNVNISYGFDRVEITDVDEDSSAKHKALQDEADKGIQDTSSITATISRDTRDNIYYTKRGNYEKLSVKTAGTILGGDNDFVKILTNGSQFIPLFWEFVLAFNVDAGVIKEISDSETVPIYERFYVGGAESVRGYDYRGDIGPEDGGNYKLVYNVEYKFPIVREKKQTILQGVFFFDVGGSWSSQDNIRLDIGQEENQMKSGFGFGIRFTTPVFPIRLDWGYGLNKKDGDKPSQFYFTIGQLF